MTKPPDLSIVPGWKGDEKYIGDTPALTPKNLEKPQPTAPNHFGPDATSRRKPPTYVHIYSGFPALDLLDCHQRAVYGYVRGWNEVGKPCYASWAMIAEATGMCERQVRYVAADLVAFKMLRKTLRPGRPSILEARMDA